MKFFYRFEKKYKKYAIHNLMYYIIILYAAGMAMQWFFPDFYWDYLCLDAKKILRGEVWRIITFMIWPPAGDPFFNIIAMYLYYSLGTTLERVWGAFRFNVYFFMGIIGHVLAALIGYLAFGKILNLTTYYLNFSLFFAFAATFPDMQFLLFFVIPIKAKWLALANGAYFLYGFIFGNMADRFAIALSMANFILFFLMTRNYNRINPKEIKRKKEFKAQVKIMPQGSTRHKCAVCGKTEKDGDHLEFRYCSKCEGNFEYCQEHLYTHQHVTWKKQTPDS